MSTKSDQVPSWKAFVIELLIYAALVAVYFFLAFHFLRDWFKDIYVHDRKLYALAALGIMIGQAVGLEASCSLLFWVLRKKKGKK